MIRLTRKRFYFKVGRVIDGSMDDKYITIKELADLKGVSTRAIRLAKSKYQIQELRPNERNDRRSKRIFLHRPRQIRFRLCGKRERESIENREIHRLVASASEMYGYIERAAEYG